MGALAELAVATKDIAGPPRLMEEFMSAVCRGELSVDEVVAFLVRGPKDAFNLARFS